MLLAAFASAALVSGCVPETEDATNPPPASSRCPGGVVSPVQVDDLVRVFRRHGLTMFNDPKCATTSERQASNLPIWGPDANGLDRDAIRESQGHVLCLFEATDLDQPLLPVNENKYPTDQETSFDFGNVICVIYPYSDTSENDQLKRLRTAATALAREVAREVAPTTYQVEADIEARLGPLMNAECTGNDGRWLCDIADAATGNEHKGCKVRLDQANRVTSPVEHCRPK